MNLQPRIVGATLGAVASLAVGGVGLAWAQEAPTTPSTEAPATGDEAPAADEDCPDKDGAGGSRTPGGTGTATAQIDL